jgi:citrate lyase subunit beta/citryl-CoA lyase
VFRSILFAPGNQPRKIEKVFSFGADIVCLDLEDAVPTAEKATARQQVAAVLDTPRGAPLYVRINSLDTPHCLSDVEAIVKKGLAGIIVPMIERASTLLTIDWLIAQLEARQNLPTRGIDILPIIETAAGIVNLPEICGAGSRVRRLSFGAWDFTLDTGITYMPDEVHIADARARVVLHSRAAGLDAPIDTSYPMLGDIDGLKRSSRNARAMGYQGKACIHPEQVAPVNDAFSVDADELKRAQTIVSEFEKAEAAGSASVRIDGRFVDYPMYKKAKALVDSQKAR